MGRAFYRFGHDVALRLEGGQAFALKDAELGAVFEKEHVPHCFLRGTFTAGTVRALIGRGVIVLSPELKALAQSVSVQLALKPELAAIVGKDAATLQQLGRRLDQNSLADEWARKMLLFETWQFVSLRPFGQATLAQRDAEPAGPEEESEVTQEGFYTALLTEMASDLWLAAEEAGEAAQPPSLESPAPLEDAVRLVFAAEGWFWEAVRGEKGLLRAGYDGQNGSWLCYTRILPELEQVTFYSICPVSVPASAVAAMTEFLCRVNAELSLGNFEMDFGHLVVRFRTGIDVTGVGLAPLLFRNMVFHNLAVMDIYLPELLSVIAANQVAIPAA